MSDNPSGEPKLKFPQIIIGCWGIGGGYTWGDQDEQTSIATLQTAFENGVTAFDTAEFYSNGYSEEVVGKALEPLRNKCLIATKIWIDKMDPATVETACRESLKRLKTDYIDLYQIHWPNADVPLEETMRAMEKLKSLGMVRKVGVCNLGPKNLELAMKGAEIVSNQLSYSALFRAVEYEILEACKKVDVAVLAYSPLAQGLLTGKFRSSGEVSDERARIRFYSKDRPGTVHNEPGYEDRVFSALERIAEVCRKADVPMISAALQWALHNRKVSSIIVGARTPDQVKANIAALDKKIDSAVLEEISSATADLKQAMGANADMWRTESRVV